MRLREILSESPIERTKSRVWFDSNTGSVFGWATSHSSNAFKRAEKFGITPEELKKYNVTSDNLDEYDGRILFLAMQHGWVRIFIDHRQPDYNSVLEGGSVKSLHKAALWFLNKVSPAPVRLVMAIRTGIGDKEADVYSMDREEVELFRKFRKLPGQKMTEGRVMTMSAPTGMKMRVYQNPSTPQISNVFKSDQMLRAIVDYRTDSYVWDAELAIHWQVSQELGIEEVRAELYDYRDAVMKEIELYQRGILATRQMESISRVPADDYGYWIMPDGQIIPTTEMSHVEAALKQLGRDANSFVDDGDGNRSFDLKQNALDEGAIRIVLDPKRLEFNMETSIEHGPSQKAVKSAIRILATCKHYDSFILENFGVSNYANAMKVLRDYL